jgi:hypothetical protein
MKPKHKQSISEVKTQNLTDVSVCSNQTVDDCKQIIVRRKEMLKDFNNGSSTTRVSERYPRE